MKLAVIVTEFGAAANIGGSPETSVRTFDMPAEVASYITSVRGTWTTVTLATADEPKPGATP